MNDGGNLSRAVKPVISAVASHTPQKKQSVAQYDHSVPPPIPWTSPARSSAARMLLAFVAAISAILLRPSAGAATDNGKEVIAEQKKNIIERPYYSYRQEIFRKYAVNMLVRQTPERGLQTLVRLFRNEFKEGDNQLNSRRRRQIYLRAADAYGLLRLAYKHRNQVEFDDEVTRWFFDSAQNLRVFLAVLSPRDNFPQGWQIIGELYRHAPRSRSRYRRLILALSVVWDQSRPSLHHQMGGMRPAYKPRITERYDYFKNLYAQRHAKVRYNVLSTSALTFVVDTPVPLSELKWVRKNVDGYGRDWGDKFTEISYRHDRIQREIYQWPHGPYTLAAIKKEGGICVEQGYYATLTARAFGIPALFFVGQGRRGPHAWVGYMQPRGDWTLDVGRYEKDRYSTGHAINPQTNMPMTDHYLQYMCDRTANASRYQMAAAYAQLAVTLVETGFVEAATKAAARSVSELAIYEKPWRIQEAVLRRKKDTETLMRLLDNKAKVFGRYPDFVANIRRKQANILVAAGLENRARYFLQRHKSLVADNRDDLQRFLANEQIRLAYADGKYDLARRRFEDLLRDQENEGSKMLGLLEAYVEFTTQTDQERRGALFLERYIPSLARRANGAQNRRILLGFLVQAYRKADMPGKAERIERDLD
ncbi:MAG: hypothetical protein R6V56_06195 [Lentisphaeria bacterium]